MADKPFSIKFDSGQSTTQDKRLAGLGVFRRVLNGRLDADGRLVARPAYTALGQSCYGSGSHVCYDLFELDGRLCSLGDRLSLARPTDVFEYVEGGAAVWKPTTPTRSSPRLPPGTGLREIGRPPDQKGGVSGFDVAAAAGFVALAYSDDASPPNGYVQLLRAGAGQSVLFSAFKGASGRPKLRLRTVGLTSRLWVVGLDSTSKAVAGDYLDPASDTSWQEGPNDLQTDAGGYALLEAARVTGAEEFVVASVAADGDLVLRRYDEDGAVIAPSGGQYGTIASIDADAIAIEANASSNTITVAVINAGALEVYTWNLSTGAQLGSPPLTPTEASGETATSVALVRATASTLVVAATLTTVGTPDVTRVQRWTYFPSTDTFSDAAAMVGLQLASGGVLTDASNRECVFGVLTDDALTTPNLLVESGPSDDDLTPVAVKDLGFAAGPFGALPRIAVDSSQTPTRYYWAHGVQSADGNSIPIVCELRLTDPGRRQVARVGRGAVIAGAMPCWYDGAQLCELGFTQRPRVVSLTSSNGAGELTGAGVYTYCVVQSWFDALGRLHRTPVSLPEDITLGAGDDTVTAVVGSVHTARHNLGSAPQGSVVRTELYRTRAIVTKTAPVLAGANSVDPPSSSLDGLSLFIYTHFADGTGGASASITFGAGDTTLTAILATINAAAAGRYTASDAVGGVALTLADEGATTSIQVDGDAGALDILGFVAFQSAQGTTETQRGEVFHLAATEYTVVGGASGDRITLTDVRDDEADSEGIESQAVLYTQLESALDDCAPLPSDRVWSGIERLEVAGHPCRETWTSSKLLEPGFAVAFAEQGQPGFGGELTESIEAVITEDLSKVYLTRRGVWMVTGEGPALNGKGTFSHARRIPADGGLVEDGWRSLLETPLGTWMQLGPDKLYIKPQGAAPLWAGFPVRELLREFPIIVAACLTGNDQLAAFALQSADGTDGRLALFDLRRQVWFQDDTGDVPAALADYQGRLCYADTSGVVHMADAAAGAGAFVPLEADTANSILFGAAGQGAVDRVLVVGELLGECTLELLVDYDDGAGYVSAGTCAMTVAAGYTIGQTVREEFDLAVQDCSQFSLRVATTGEDGSAGLAFVTIEVHAERQAGSALLGNAHRR